METFVLHPAMFKPPSSQRTSPRQFREALEEMSPVLLGISTNKINAYGFTGLHLMGDDAPNTLEEVRVALESRPYGDLFPIYHSHCETTILAKNCAHTAYRAWHDLVHCEVDGAFTLPGEILVINAQIDEMIRNGCDGIPCAIVWYDIMGQLLHNYKYDKFPEISREFVEACMCKGLQFALSFKW